MCPEQVPQAVALQSDGLSCTVTDFWKEESMYIRRQEQARRRATNHIQDHDSIYSGTNDERRP